jgi:hypothetical protein
LAGRRYYSIRTGKHPLGSKLDLITLLRLFNALYSDLERRGYFQEAFGYTCVDAGDMLGTIGADIEAYFLIKLRKDNLWPIRDKDQNYSEEDLFDVIELLYDHVSKPMDGFDHSYGDCGWHYNTFDQMSGRNEYRTRINELLKDYKDGYELSQEGEILTLAILGTEALFEDNPPLYDEENVDRRVAAAIDTFRRYHSSLEDKRNAVKALADVLEFLKPKLKEVLTRADENDLFEVANKFGIRHHNEKQKTDYDQAIWLDWMFYYYLATVNATIRLINKNNEHST